MRTKHFLGILLVAGCLVPLFLAGPSWAQTKVIELSYATSFGPEHTFSIADQKWMSKIEKETNGRVKIKPFWGGTLLGPTDGADEVAQGVADIGQVNPAYAKSGYAFTKASFLFFYGASQDVGRHAMKEMLKKFPQIEQEYQGVKVLAWASGFDYQAISRKPIRKLSDFRGMRMRSTGQVAALLKILNAEGVAIGGHETYVNIQKGILDGTIQPYETFKSGRLAEVAKYATALNLYRPHTGDRMMNLNAWNKLPKDIQKIFEDNIEYWGQELDNECIKANAEGIEIGKKAGVEYITLSKEESKQLDQLIAQQALRDAKDLDTKGLPGTKMYQEAQRLVKELSKK
jgi:TRAP-type transport system periplasmic protein